ncbi:diaminopimelate decarboxylase [Streptomyces tsukubensis]|uniref:Diaminopimelate decarboxylase n=1 Tax=Streptomyces tsukubensis TaxID=83656 RepID=A0A1V4AB58_9ACTN|nr:diaminopimelate decarboxylase [Streptomyces tsukubensis]OON80669.1 diaminopimelate decarboxylase [Streptomyces tsukubensis]QFR96333.1 Y4yA family PLP-dependent enzyme [Streptomyces tsukubensis]
MNHDRGDRHTVGGALYLEPRLEPPLASLIEDSGFLHQLVGGLGSPLNVLLPQVIAGNVESFRQVYRERRLRGEILFAHKANRSSALVRQLAATEADIDVASLEELQHALGAGFSAGRIGATGPKDPDFLWLGARAGVTFHVDGRSELEELISLVRRCGLPRVRVLPRLSGFTSSGVRRLARLSRFGTPAADTEALLDLLESAQDAVELIGFGYHLDTVSLDEKAVALEGCVAVMDHCAGRGMRPRTIDVGGGFGVSYLAEADQWNTYTTELTRAVMGTRPPLTWRGHGYGLRNDMGTLAGALSLYPAHREQAGAEYLAALFDMEGPVSGRPLGSLLLEGLYDVRVAPGRALVDQCGLTLARVMEVGRVGAGPATHQPGESGADWFVRLGMNASDCSLEDHGVLMDPLIVPAGGPRTGEPRAGEARAGGPHTGGARAGVTRDDAEGPRAAGEGPVAVHLFGNLCLEADLITKRAVHLPHLPVPGDLLCFANTAGYCMDFSAHRAERRPEARKVAVHLDAEGHRSWRLDEDYWPMATAGERA